MVERQRGSGFKVCTPFPCDELDVGLLLRALDRFPFVDAIWQHAPRYANGGIHFRIDLARVFEGDGPSAEAMVIRELEITRSRHRLRTPPPPKE